MTFTEFSQLDEQDTAAQGIAGMRDLFLIRILPLIDHIEQIELPAKLLDYFL
jgi:hypothetical protein